MIGSLVGDDSGMDLPILFLFGPILNKESFHVWVCVVAWKNRHTQHSKCCISLFSPLHLLFALFYDNCSLISVHTVNLPVWMPSHSTVSKLSCSLVCRLTRTSEINPLNLFTNLQISHRKRPSRGTVSGLIYSRLPILFLFRISNRFFPLTQLKLEQIYQWFSSAQIGKPFFGGLNAKSVTGKGRGQEGGDCRQKKKSGFKIFDFYDADARVSVKYSKRWTNCTWSERMKEIW